MTARCGVRIGRGKAEQKPLAVGRRKSASPFTFDRNDQHLSQTYRTPMTFRRLRRRGSLSYAQASRGRSYVVEEVVLVAVALVVAGWIHQWSTVAQAQADACLVGDGTRRCPRYRPREIL